MDLCNSAEYATAMAQAALNDGLDPVAYASNYGLNLNASHGIRVPAASAVNSPGFKVIQVSDVL